MYMFKLWNVVTGVYVRIMLHGVQMLDISCLRRRNIRNIISSTLNVDHHNNTNAVRSAFLSILVLNLVRCKYSTVLRIFFFVHTEGRPTIASYWAGKIKFKVVKFLFCDLFSCSHRLGTHAKAMWPPTLTLCIPTPTPLVHFNSRWPSVLASSVQGETNEKNTQF